jgi:hypothetical protein
MAARANQAQPEQGQSVERDGGIITFDYAEKLYGA